MRTRVLVVISIGLVLIIAGAILRSSILIIVGVLWAVMSLLRFTQLDRWKDPEQREMYLQTYKKEWEEKKKR
jgi:hypothetical protein